MKNLIDCKITDEIFVADKNEDRYKKFQIEEISRDRKYLSRFRIEGYSLSISFYAAPKVRRLTVEGPYRRIFVIFANESEAIRYCKAQKIKILNNLIDSAKKEIEKVRDFRKSNWDLLNRDWTDKEIANLESSLH